MNTKLALFEEKEIRKIYKNNNWYYNVNDVITFLTNTSNPSEYLKKLKQKDLELQRNWNNLCIKINMRSKDDKIRKYAACNNVGILRLIESLQISKAESFKMWMAKLGNERLDEINSPELAMDRMKTIYKFKGYSSNWIEQREREVVTKHSLNEEWGQRGVNNNKDYQILMNEIYKNNFGIGINEYKKIKAITEFNELKDSMTNLELAFINLAETIIAKVHHKNNSRDLSELKRDISEVGKILNNTQNSIEEKLNIQIINPENHIKLTNLKE